MVDASADAPEDAPEDVTDAVDVPVDTGPMCTGGTTDCGGACVDTQTSVANCGACGVVCSSVLHGAAACVSGACSFACETGFHACGGGCVSDDSAESCGARCAPCVAPPHAVATCAAGACGSACDAGFADCDGDSDNGCEIDTRSAVAHCGACGRACPTVDHGSATCVAATCGVLCDAGLGFIDGACEPISAPRPLAPLSLGDVSLRRPTLRWERPVGVTGAVVELCRDRACTDVIETLRATGNSARPTGELPARSVVFWRLRGRVGDTDGAALGPTWLFHVPARDNSGGVDTSYTPHLDVNGDGFDDVAVGAPNAHLGERFFVGAVRVFLGTSSGIQSSPTLTLPGDGGWFGFSVSCAGDVNGDGYADLVVGAPAFNASGRDAAGRVDVYHGGRDGLSATPALRREGATATGFMGGSVATAGDVDADGYADVLVGARGVDLGAVTDVGATYVFRGGPSGIGPAPAQVLEGASRGDAFGAAVASVGDVNGDGYSDVVVGATGVSVDGDSNRGAAYVFHGNAFGVEASPARTMHGDFVSDNFGKAVASAGDMNGDGYSDVVVGAWQASPRGRTWVGAAYVFSGASTGAAATPTHTFEGVERDDNFGVSVASADINGDGFADVIVSANTTSPGAAYAGSVFVFHGGASRISSSPDQRIDGLTTRDFFGYSVHRAGDVNGDGYDDIIVGAPGVGPSDSFDVGAAYIFHGANRGLQWPAATTLTGSRSSDEFGHSVASLPTFPWRLNAHRRASDTLHRARLSSRVTRG